MSHKHLLGAVLALVGAFSAPAAAQAVQLDFSSYNPEPSSAYGGAAGQVGVWNHMTTSGPLGLVNTAGAPTAVSVSASTFVNFGFGFNNVNTAGDDELLLDGGHDGNLTLDFSGLAPGDYTVYTYAWAPDSRTAYFTNVNVTGSTSGQQTVGGADWTGTHVLGVTYAKHVVTVTSGTLQVVCTLSSGFVTVNGVQIEPSGPPIITYCTAKTTSNGCTPSIGSSGTPSATAGSGFLVNGSGFMNNKNCLLFYGVSGQATIPFQGGTLCVSAPIKRTPGTNTGGNPPPNDCSGVPSIDMNLFAAGGLGGTPLPVLSVAGTVVNCQWWGRDPGFVAPNNTQLSNGIEYTTGP